MTLGERIRYLRLKMDMTRPEMADRLGTTATSVYRWETGKAQPMQVFRQRMEVLAAKMRLNGARGGRR